ncbi:hypothetical protein HAX54_046693, partial [Datura stramonium]|nr:hypothetical protein [Datura stramonium]
LDFIISTCPVASATFLTCEDGSMVPKVLGEVWERKFASFGVSTVEIVNPVPRLSDSFWAFGRLFLCGLSIDFIVHLVKTTSNGHFIDSIESRMLFLLGKHIRKLAIAARNRVEDVCHSNLSQLEQIIGSLQTGLSPKDSVFAQIS